MIKIISRWSIMSLLCVLMIGASCKKDTNPTPKPDVDPSTPKASGKTLFSFSFDQAKNTSLSRNYTATIKDSTILITVQEGVSLSSLIPTFRVSDKATVSINGKEISSGVTPINASNTIRIKVTAENGKSSSYNLLARNGNSTYDSYVYSMMKEYAIPGVSIAISKDEKLVYSAGYGFANIRERERVTTTHLFRLASCSKAQTALCIMSLYEEGKLNMNSKVFGPEGILKDEFTETTDNPFVDGVKDITVENLLYHNSGWTVEAIFDTWGTPYYSLNTLDERIDYLVHNQAFGYSRGTTYSYSNISYSILGRIIEKLSGTSYESYLRQIVAKAGVTDMWCSKTKIEDKRDNEVVYYPQNGTTGYQNNMEIVGGCGAVIASAPDIIKIICAQDYGTVVPDILKKETLDLLYTPSPNYNRYMHGWRTGHSYYTNWASYHGGNLAGVGTLMIRGKKGVNAVILCNSRSYNNNSSGVSFDTQLYTILGNIMADLGN